MPIGVYDIETRSTVNLTLCGAWNYAAHPSTSILCMYLAVDDGEPERWLSGDPIPLPSSPPPSIPTTGS